MERVEVGFAAPARAGTTFPAQALDRCRAADGIVMGPVSHAEYPPRAEGGLNPSGELRIGLDLYANVRPSRTRAGIAHWGRTPMDVVFVRENTEGFYADRNMHAGTGELMPAPDLALAVRKVTARASRRIARIAFELARRRRGKVTVVHKRNVMRVSDALFVGEVEKVARDFPDVALDDQLVDSMAALLVRGARDRGRGGVAPRRSAHARDLGGALGTREFAAAACAAISPRSSPSA